MQMPGPVVQEDGGKKLPSVGRVDALVAQAEILADEARLVGVEKNLRDECADIYADQPEQNDARPLRPAPGKRRRFSAGQAHVTRVSQRKSVVDEFWWIAPAIAGSRDVFGCGEAADGDIERRQRSIHLQRRQHPQPAGPNLEFHRAISDELTVDFHRHALPRC